MSNVALRAMLLRFDRERCQRDAGLAGTGVGQIGDVRAHKWSWSPATRQGPWSGTAVGRGSGSSGTSVGQRWDSSGTVVGQQWDIGWRQLNARTVGRWEQLDVGEGRHSEIGLFTQKRQQQLLLLLLYNTTATSSSTAAWESRHSCACQFFLGESDAEAVRSDDRSR